MAGSGALAKGIFAVVGKFFKESAVELRAPFRDLSLGGHDFALAGAGGGTLPSRRFGDEMRRWAQDAKRGEDNIAYMGKNDKNSYKFLPNARKKVNESAGEYASRDEAVGAAKKSMGNSRSRIRPECGRGDHVHVDTMNTKGEVTRTTHFGFPKKNK